MGNLGEEIVKFEDLWFLKEQAKENNWIESKKNRG
jgi:hypothetical protein